MAPKMVSRILSPTVVATVSGKRENGNGKSAFKLSWTDPLKLTWRPALCWDPFLASTCSWPPNLNWMVWFSNSSGRPEKSNTRWSDCIWRVLPLLYTLRHMKRTVLINIQHTFNCAAGSPPSSKCMRPQKLQQVQNSHRQTLLPHSFTPISEPAMSLKRTSFIQDGHITKEPVQYVQKINSVPQLWNIHSI